MPVRIRPRSTVRPAPTTAARPVWAAGTFVINPATPTASITNSPVTYNGLVQTATVACLGGGAATLASGGTGTNAGSYPATVDCAASANYSAAHRSCGRHLRDRPGHADGLDHQQPGHLQRLAANRNGRLSGRRRGHAGQRRHGHQCRLYPATVDCAASANYSAASGLAPGNFVIDPATPTACRSPTTTRPTTARRKPRR